MTPIKHMEAKAKKSAARGVVVCGTSGSAMLIIGAQMQWGTPAALMVSGVIFILISAFFFVAFRELNGD